MFVQRVEASTQEFAAAVRDDDDVERSRQP
jgi:hypothetical protein